MKRRGYLTVAGSGAVALAGFTALATSRNDARAEYQGDQKVVYDHDSLDLRLGTDRADIGDEVEFEVVNTGDSGIVLGCQKPVGYSAVF
jgi:hypothetical protein